MKSIIITTVLLVSFIGQAQFNLNDYQYVVVPKKFNDFKKENQFLTSTLVKHLFTKKGFETVYDDNLPTNLIESKCLALYVDLNDDSSMFTTKTTLSLKDCYGKEVLLSQQGRSKNKDFVAAYNEAVTFAFKTIDALDYSYVSKAQENAEEPVVISFKNDVKTVEEKENIAKDSMITQVVTLENQSYEDRTPVASDYKKGEAEEKKTIVQKATQEEQSFKSNEPITTDYQKGESVIKKESQAKSISGVLYAQELPNGYQLVDSTPKIQLKIFKSSMPNVYLAKAEDKDGVVYTSDGKWFFEYYNEGEMVVEELQIKF